MDKNLVDWYSSYLISRKDKLQNISKTVVADAFFSKETFVTPMSYCFMAIVEHDCQFGH